MLNCWVIETNDAPLPVQRLDDAGEVRQRPGQPVDLVDDDHIDQPLAQIGQQPLQGRSLHRAAREAAIVVSGLHQLPAFMGLTLYIGLAGLPLGIEGVERLLQPLLRRLPGIDRAAFDPGTHGLAFFRPKNKGPDQRVPVMRRATSDREVNRSPQ